MRSRPGGAGGLLTFADAPGSGKMVPLPVIAVTAAA
jgi:hypothetical protein